MGKTVVSEGEKVSSPTGKGVNWKTRVAGQRRRTVSGENWVAVYCCGEAMALTVLQAPQPAGLAMAEN